MKLIKGLVIFFGIIVVIILLVLGYLGYIKPIANVLGTNKPVDLGIKYTDSDLGSVKQKFGVELVEIESSDPNNSIRYEGEQKVEKSFTDEEITAMVNSKKWIYTPVTNVQIKIGEDGTIESSGTLMVSRLANYFSAVSGATVSTDEVNKAVGILPKEVPYYISGTASVSNGDVSIDVNSFSIGKKVSFINFMSTAYANSVNASVSSFKVGQFAISQSIISSYKDQINSFLTTRLNKISGLKANLVTFEKGEMNFSGTMPTKKYRVVK